MTAVLESIIEQKNKEAEMLINNRNKELEQYVCTEFDDDPSEVEIRFIGEDIQMMLNRHIKHSLESKSYYDYFFCGNKVGDKYIKENALHLFFVHLKALGKHGLDFFKDDFLAKIFVDWINYYGIHLYSKDDLFYSTHHLADNDFIQTEQGMKMTNCSLGYVFNCSKIIEIMKEASNTILVCSDAFSATNLNTEEVDLLAADLTYIDLYNACLEAKSAGGILDENKLR